DYYCVIWHNNACWVF
nr:immunoglobulin light chain junction region [Macaca mulatta]